MDEINFSVSPLQPNVNNNKGVSEDKAIPEESQPSKEAVPEITGSKGAENETNWCQDKDGLWHHPDFCSDDEIKIQIPLLNS